MAVSTSATKAPITAEIPITWWAGYGVSREHSRHTGHGPTVGVKETEGDGVGSGYRINYKFFYHSTVKCKFRTYFNTHFCIF